MPWVPFMMSFPLPCGYNLTLAKAHFLLPSASLNGFPSLSYWIWNSNRCKTYTFWQNILNFFENKYSWDWITKHFRISSMTWKTSIWNWNRRPFGLLFQFQIDVFDWSRIGERHSWFSNMWQRNYFRDYKFPSFFNNREYDFHYVGTRSEKLITTMCQEKEHRVNAVFKKI